MISLPSEVKKILDESYEQRFKIPKKTIELPCTKNHKWQEPVIMEITEARDQRIACPKCGKVHYLAWSKLQDNIKWQK